MNFYKFSLHSIFLLTRLNLYILSSFFLFYLLSMKELSLILVSYCLYSMDYLRIFYSLSKRLLFLISFVHLCFFAKFFSNCQHHPTFLLFFNLFYFFNLNENSIMFDTLIDSYATLYQNLLKLNYVMPTSEYEKISPNDFDVAIVTKIKIHSKFRAYY